MTALALVIAKDEYLIFFDRTTNGAAKLIPVAFWHAEGLRERVSSEIGIRALEIKRRAVPIVGARPRLRRQHHANGFPKLRVIILRSNLHLVDRFQVRIDHDDPQNRVLIVRAVQFESAPREVLALR